MSTKIYYAWRIPKDMLNEFIDYLRPQAYEYAEGIIRNLIGAVTPEGVEKQRKEHPYYKEDRLKLEHVLSLCKKASEDIRRHPVIDVDSGFNIWLFGTHFYVIPIGEFQEYKVPDFAEDYSYWNNTDQPENISDEEWNSRSETWNSINGGGGFGDTSAHNSRRLYHSFIDMSARYGDFDFEYEMERRFCPRTKK